MRRWLATTVALAVVFAWPLYDLTRLSLHSELYSHALLIPIVSAYLVWLKRDDLPLHPATRRNGALILLVCGLLGLAAYAAIRLSAAKMAVESRLFVGMSGFLLGFTGVCAWHFDRRTLRSVAFPLGFLVFMVPMPTFVIDGIEVLLQHGSAWAAFAMLKLTGTPVLRQDLMFQLPGITLQVAPECSGIRSSLALFITSIVGGYLFLDSPWRRATLAAFVLPLAVLRNGFRVFTIGELCVNMGPHMIESWVHRHGGPFFFALSLIPFSLVLFLLTRQERNARHVSAASP